MNWRRMDWLGGVKGQVKYVVLPASFIITKTAGNFSLYYAIR